jgi:hypothetical protein
MTSPTFETSDFASPSNDPQPSWQRRAPELARWAWTHLVMRTDAWGIYLPIESRRVNNDKT